MRDSYAATFVGAALVKVTVQVEVAPGLIVVGLHCHWRRSRKRPWLTAAVWRMPPAVAVTVAV